MNLNHRLGLPQLVIQRSAFRGGPPIKLRKPSRSPFFGAAFFFVVSLSRKKRLFESLSWLPPSAGKVFRGIASGW